MVVQTFVRTVDGSGHQAPTRQTCPCHQSQRRRTLHYRNKSRPLALQIRQLPMASDGRTEVQLAAEVLALTARWTVECAVLKLGEG